MPPKAKEHAHPKTPKNPKGAGRPPIPIEYDVVKKLRRLDCSDWEIAAFLDISMETYRTRKKKDPQLLEAIKKGEAEMNISLRRLLWNYAQTKYVVAIFLAKQILGYVDEPMRRAEENQPLYLVPKGDGTWVESESGAWPVKAA